MSRADDRFPKPEAGLDELVRAQLDAEASRVDPHPLCTGVLARLDADTPPAPSLLRGRWRRAVAGAAAWAGLAAAVFFAVVLVTRPQDARATPAEVVAAAREKATREPDRCYRVTIDISPRVKDVLPFVAHDRRPHVVCTRGTRFVVEPGLGGKGAWGQDADGRFWAAPSREAAARYDEEELPLPLRNAIKLMGLDLRTLLDEVLSHFELAWSEPSAADTWTVLATRRKPTGVFRVRSIELVVDKRTRVIRSLTVTRTLPGDEVAKLRLDLQATTTKPDAVYTAEGHLDPGAPVYDRSNPVSRRRLMVRHLGEVLSQGL